MSGIQDLAKKGRNGDNTLMHVSQDEVAGLNALARDMMGRELTTNPETGLPEAFLFAPFAAPLLAGGVGSALGIGGGALATGLTAGALGAAEAEIRGMDDPLRRGLYSGLTAGAASGIGNALSGAGEAGTAAAGAGEAGTKAATTGAPDLSGSVAGAGSAAAPPSVSPQSYGQSTAIGAAAPPTVSPQSYSQSTAIGSSGGGGSNFMNMFRDSQYGDIGQMGKGIQNISQNEAARKQFMEQVRLPATAGAVGLGGQAQMRAQDEMKERKEAADREKAAELKEAQDRIRANYASVGRPMPTGFSGSPLFKQGGIVGLYDGGSPGAGRGGFGGPSRGSSGGGSRGGGGGRDDDRGPGTNPGRPGGESGMRGPANVGSGGRDGGSTAAVQQPQLDPQKIEQAVMDSRTTGEKISQGIQSIAMMSPTMRALSYLGRDRRGLKGASPHGPGAPLTDAEKGYGRGLPERSNRPEGGGGGGNAPIIPQATASSTQPTLPLMAERTPTPNYDEFLAQLQQGAGNRAAMQQSGYGMASGGYLDGGVLPGDGMSDDVPAMIDGDQPAALSSGEFVIPADVVSHIGNGSSDSGAKQLYAMMDRIREARTGEDDQAPKINPKKMMPK